MSLLGAEITEHGTGHVWRIVGGGSSATRSRVPVWIASNVTEFGAPEEFTIGELRARFAIPDGERLESPDPEPIMERPVDSLEAMTARERRMRRRLTPKTTTRSVREYSPEDVFNGRVPEEYQPRAQEIAEGIVADPAKLREFHVNGHRYSQPVRAAVANALAEKTR